MVDSKPYSKYNIKLIHQMDGQRLEYESVAQDFLISVLKEFIEPTHKFYKHGIIDAPYKYNERQLNSFLLPILSKLCDAAVLAECPVHRKIQSRIEENCIDSSGRIDYWCIYKNYSFIIEVKHNYDCFTTPNPKKRLIENWEYLNKKQICSSKQAAKIFEENTKGVIPLSLHFITCYAANTPGNRSEAKKYARNIEGYLIDLKTKLSVSCPGKTTANFRAALLMPKAIVDLDTQNNEIIPAVLLMARINKPVSHKGIKIV